MRYLIRLIAGIALGFCLMGTLPVHAQNKTLSKKELKQQEKTKKQAEKRAIEQAAYEKALGLVQSQRYVFQASSIAGRQVTPRVNFLIVDGDKLIFQFSVGNEVGGRNGIGGRTIKGKIQNYKVIPGKNTNKPIHVTFDAIPEQSMGRTRFTLSIYGEEYADMMLNGVPLRGSILKPEDAKVFVASWL